MDVAAVLWSALVLGLVLGVVGVRRSPDRSGLALAGVGSALIAGFSFVAGFSIGPITMGLAALVAALATARGLPRTTWAFVASLASLACWLLFFSSFVALASYSFLLVPLLCTLAYLIAFVATLVDGGPADSAH